MVRLAVAMACGSGPDVQSCAARAAGGPKDDKGHGAVTATVEKAGALGTLEHDALFYANDDEYVAGVVGFVREGLQRDCGVARIDDRVA